MCKKPDNKYCKFLHFHRTVCVCAPFQMLSFYHQFIYLTYSSIFSPSLSKILALRFLLSLHWIVLLHLLLLHFLLLFLLFHFFLTCMQDSVRYLRRNDSFFFFFTLIVPQSLYSRKMLCKSTDTHKYCSMPAQIASKKRICEVYAMDPNRVDINNNC